MRRTLLFFLLCCSSLKAEDHPADVRALNRGRFTLTYRLARDGDRARADFVSVRVNNKASFFEPPTALLKNHEDGHRRINEAEAVRIEEELKRFEVTMPAGQKNMRAAEKTFRAQFNQKVRQTEELHRAWDGTNTVPPR